MTKSLTIIALVIAANCHVSSAKEADDPTSTQLANGDLLITNFEQKDLGRMRAWGWQFQGDAFNREYSHGSRKLRARVGRYEGKWFLTSVTENPNFGNAFQRMASICFSPFGEHFVEILTQ